MKKLIAGIFIVTLVISLFSCTKIKENFIIRGKWELKTTYLDGNKDVNFMEIVLPGYDSPEGCCRYIIDYQDDNIAYGFYYRNDTLVYAVKGTWEMIDKNHMYNNIDKYINGIFKIERDGLREFILTSDENDANFLGNILTLPIEMHVERLKK